MTKREILETENMLQRLTAVLISHAPASAEMATDDYDPQARADAESLRRISMTLHRWHELECGDGNDYASWTIARGHKRNGAFEYDDNGKPYIEWRAHNANGARYLPTPDRERGALKRLAAILKRYPGLSAYVQTDPRGCALYIMRPGDLADGWSVWCREDREPNGTPGAMVRATRQTFPTKESAIAYMQGINISREPELRQEWREASECYTRGIAVHR